MVIVVGPLDRYDVREPDCHYGDAGQCVRQQVYVLPENRHWLPGVFSSVGPIVSLFERLVGPFPYEKLSHLQSSTRYGGMENASALFFGALGSYYATYRHGTALSDDLQRELEKTSGRSLAQYFDQWLRRPGVAEPSIGWARDPSTGEVSLLVLQQDARGPFELPLPLMITRADGTSARLTVMVPAQARAIVPLPGRFDVQPRAIGFDPDRRLLARIAAL